jgi:hypothetical protein
VRWSRNYEERELKVEEQSDEIPQSGRVEG